MEERGREHLGWPEEHVRAALGYVQAFPDEVWPLVEEDVDLIFVTFDVRTIPEVLRFLAEARIEHGGAVLVSTRSFRQDDFKGLTAAMGAYIASSNGKEGGTAFCSSRDLDPSDQ